jgi:hypothetical protein
VGHVSRSSGLLHVEASLTRVSQLGVQLKILFCILSKLFAALSRLIWIMFFQASSFGLARFLMSALFF